MGKRMGRNREEIGKKIDCICIYQEKVVILCGEWVIFWKQHKQLALASTPASAQDDNYTTKIVEYYRKLSKIIYD